ncbi:MAG TPA: hypothetical protein VHC97_22410 [Thermoanaerobaculia bacterium]|jgi:hypothetical protein|nr:hypothetical protein [Thermoanaerobaculia bacterium]
MIAFVTLLLGLISGVYPIEVTVSGPVAAVEFTVDGAPAGRIDPIGKPPWVGRVDLGRGLRPRELVARALDAEGKEIARASQWLNLPRPPAEVEIVLEREEGVPKAAVLTWQIVSGVKPASVDLTLDGEPLKVDARGRAGLPPRDLKSLHVLTAELWFPPGLVARKDVAYGGEYGSEVSTELTAVPVKVSPGTALPGPEGLQDWFFASGRPAPVAAVEDGPGKVVIVRVPGANEVLSKLLPPQQRSSLAPAFRRQMLLGEEDQVRFLSLSGNPFRNSRVPAELFDMSPPLGRKDGGVFWYLTNTRMPVRKGAEQSLADAVAVAGLQATAENRRRAVVLVLGNDAKDSSRYDPAAARAYLESIHVPLFVWSLYGTNSQAARAWGTPEEIEDISNTAKLERAVARLRAELDAQKIVWIEGRHLPQAVTLSPSAQGVVLPGIR